ncbi:hypothetical protein PAXINDRAFT_133241, partial [Paxillus involutus ATCC 200175]
MRPLELLSTSSFTGGSSHSMRSVEARWAILISNAAVAFLLNVAAVSFSLVSAGSELVLTLAGVFKDILLITGSVLCLEHLSHRYRYSVRC